MDFTKWLIKAYVRQPWASLVDVQLTASCLSKAKKSDKKMQKPQPGNGQISDVVNMLIGNRHHEQVKAHVEEYLMQARQLYCIFQNLAGNAVWIPEFSPALAGPVALWFQAEQAWLRGYNESESTIVANIAMSYTMREKMWLLGPKSLSSLEDAISQAPGAE